MDKEKKQRMEEMSLEQLTVLLKYLHLAGLFSIVGILIALVGCFFLLNGAYVFSYGTTALTILAILWARHLEKKGYEEAEKLREK